MVDYSKIYQNMRQEMADKSLLEKARTYGYNYIDSIEERPVYPQNDALDKLSIFHEDIPQKGMDGAAILDMLQQYAMPATINQLCGRYYGFVNGGVLPISMATKWLTTIWDQNAALYHTSPINACIEEVVQKWLVQLFGLPAQTVAGYVAGSSVAIFAGLSAARYRLYKNIGWDINKKGLYGAPLLNVYVSAEAHSTVKKALCLLGIGTDNITWLECDDNGRIIIDNIPPMDNKTLLITGAGNVNSGAFDNFEALGKMVQQANGWLHIDGAFGLWAAASSTLKYLTKGIEYGSSWSVDGHKTLNVPYDNGIILCKDEDALINALQATGAYMLYDDTQRSGMYYTPEMSRRARAIELWASFKYLGADGIDMMVSSLHAHTKTLSQALEAMGYAVLNDVEFNQILIKGKDDASTQKLIEFVQNTGRCWVGGSQWQGDKVMRISICNWITTPDDIEEVIGIFKKSLSLNVI